MPSDRTNSSAIELLVQLDRDSAVPAHAQLEAAIREGIRSGRLAPDSPVPSSRRLADDLGLSRGVVVEAYQQLTAEGYLVSRAGGYTRVATGVTRTSAPQGAPLAGTETPRPRFDFSYGRPDVTQFPRAAWLRAVRAVLAEAPHERLSYIDARGAPEFRTAVADYLNRVRGTWASPDHVVACNGFAQAIALVLPVLRATGRRVLAVEDPCDSDAVRTARETGLEVVGVPVDADGIDVDALERTGADAVLVTPAHQFPTGAVLSAERRSRLLAWARRTDAYILEDDYDAEHRYDQTPVGALHGLAPDRVVYAGTASKTLAPGLRLGWMIAPESLVRDVAAAKFAMDRGSPVLDQLAFARFVETGDLDRHLRRMRPIYRRRRDLLIEAVAGLLPELEPVGIAAGLHVVAWLPEDVPEPAVLAAAARRGVQLSGVGEYRLAASPHSGLLLGYGRLPESAVRAGVEQLHESIAEARG